jgi:hypothetical protein
MKSRIDASLSPQKGASSGRGWKKGLQLWRVPEQAAANRRQGAIIQLGGWAWPHHMDTQLFWKEVISIQNQISAQSKLRGAGGTHEKPIRLDSIPIHIPPPRRSMELVYKSSQDRIQEMENVTKIILYVLHTAFCY